MQIVEKYSNFINEVKDTLNTESSILKDLKLRSVACKAFGALCMVASAAFAIGAIAAAIPTGGLSLIALTGTVAFGILGYDLAAMGHSIRKHIDNPVAAVAQKVWEKPISETLNDIKDGVLKFGTDLINKGAEKAVDTAIDSYFMDDTIVFSRIHKFIVALQKA
jgi:hypothetical protein